MTTIHNRLKRAREAAGYGTAADAARAMGAKTTTYQGHENSGRGLRVPVLERYAKFFRVSPEWLMTGKPTPEPKTDYPRVMIHGYVKGGAEIEEAPAEMFMRQKDFLELWNVGQVGALEVEGDSMRPRFLPGEFILFETSPRLPAELIDQYAIVQTLDGRRMIKILRRGRSEGKWRLDSHNAEPMEDVELLAAWRYCGVVPPSVLTAPEAASTSARSIARRNKSG